MEIEELDPVPGTLKNTEVKIKSKKKKKKNSWPNGRKGEAGGTEGKYQLRSVHPKWPNRKTENFELEFPFVSAII